MEHVPQADIIRFAAGELDQTRKQEVERHLDHCADCRQALQDQQAAWRTLGEWSPQPADADLFAAVEARLDAATPTRRSFWTSVGRASRVAAAIAIGVGAGYTAARTSGSSTDENAPVSVSVETARQNALTELRVEHFENYAPAGLLSAWQDMTAPEQTEDQP